MPDNQAIQAQRIVSLIASATEIVCALGFGDRLVGCSHECDYPDVVKRLPRCTEPKFEVAGTSGDIDRRVKEIVQDALSVYRVDAELLKTLDPDVIVTQTQCEVCAVSERDVDEVVRSWVGAAPRIVSLKPDALADIWRDIEQVAAALGVPERAQEVVDLAKSRMAAVADRAAGARARPRVACIEWIDPLMAAGNWMPELVEIAGGVNLFGEAGKHSPWMTWEALAEADPDIILALPCGFDIARTQAEMPTLAGRPDWGTLKAARAGHVYLADGNQYFNRPGPRIVESLEILAEILHPDRFHYGHEGTGWVRF